MDRSTCIPVSARNSRGSSRKSGKEANGRKKDGSFEPGICDHRNRFEVLDDDELMQINDSKEQSGINTEGSRKFEEPLNGNAGNGSEAVAHIEPIQINGSKTKGGRKFEEPLNGNGVSAKGGDENGSSSSKKVIVPVPPKDCSFSQFIQWVKEETKDMDLDGQMGFLRSIPVNPKYKEDVPEDKEWRRIDSPYFTSYYPPPYERPRDFSYLFDEVMAKKLGQPFRDIIADKKTRYTIGEGKHKSKLGKQEE